MAQFVLFARCHSTFGRRCHITEPTSQGSLTDVRSLRQDRKAFAHLRGAVGKSRPIRGFGGRSRLGPNRQTGRGRHCGQVHAG
jgi:hypothetical protein